MNHYVIGDFVRDLRDDTYGIIESFSTRTGFARVKWRRYSGFLLRPEDAVFNSPIDDPAFTYATQYKVGDRVSDPFHSRGVIQRFELVGTLWHVWANWFQPSTKQFSEGHRRVSNIR